jgi:nucleoside-diphosphate-sugar epimerase
MNILVLGGTRFFGKTLVEQLGSAGHAVTVLSRGKLPPPAGAAHLVADRADPAALASALAGRSFDVVIDNVAMTAAHVSAALDAIGDRTGHYVLTSTAAVYGDFAHGRVWRESDLDLVELERPLPGGDAYTIGKRAAEAVLWRGERSKVPFTIVRPARSPATHAVLPAAPLRWRAGARPLGRG